jgi:hypothetical protein
MGMWLDNADHEDALSDLTRCGDWFAADLSPTDADCHERALRRAVLQEAILDIRGCATGVSPPERERAAKSAYYWVVSRDMTWPYSFENVCAILGLNADGVRDRLLRQSVVNQEGEVASVAPPVVPEGGKLGWARRVRLRGNRQRGVLKLRQRSHARAAARAGAGAAGLPTRMRRGEMGL